MRIIRRPELRALAIAGLAACLGIASLCVILIVRTNTNQQFREQTVSNCLEINKLKAAIRGTFMDARERALAQPGLDEAQRVAINAAYATELARYRADDCPTP